MLQIKIYVVEYIHVDIACLAAQGNGAAVYHHMYIMDNRLGNRFFLRLLRSFICYTISRSFL